MDFRRKLSAGSESFTEGTSRFFSSVIAKKNGLMNDLSNKIESVGASAASLMKGSSSNSSISDSEGIVYTDTRREVTKVERKPRPETRQVVKAEVNPIQRSYMDKENEHYTQSLDRNQNGHMRGKYAKRQGSLASSEGSGNEEMYVTPGVNMSFDEPLYSPSKVHTFERQHSTGIGPSWKGTKTPPPIPPPPFNPNKTGRRSSRSSCNSPKLSSGRSSGHSSDSEGKYDRYYTEDQVTTDNKTEFSIENEINSLEKYYAENTDDSKSYTADKNYDSVEDKTGGKNNIGRTENRDTSEDTNRDTVEERSKAPTFSSTKRRSSTVDEMLFDDYVEPESEPEPVVEPEKAVTADVDVQNKRKTLLPMGDLISFDEPELEDFHPKKVLSNKSQPSEKSFPSVSSVDSSEAVFEEQGLNTQTSVDSSEPEYEKDRTKRLDSVSSVRSWSSDYSLDSQPDDLTLECMGFMKQFVDMIFNPRGQDISQVEKAKFGEYVQQVPGRQWFARYVNSQRVVSKKVEESIFFRLVQYFAVVLFECNEAEDYVPAKTLMNMCFTFYYETRHGKQRQKNFLYSYLREQPIWQSLRFWNAAFFDAVQNERARKPVCTSEDGHDSQNDDSMFQENITFGQLGTFTCNMRAFGLSKELCLEFLRKQSVIADLKPDQIKMIRDNIEKWKDR